MSRDLWVISDTHFFHDKILTFKDGRPEFSNVDEMNDLIVERWNSVVKPGDRVYHLGDVTMDYGDRFDKLWKRLHGSKRLIVGNHDDIKFFARGGYFKDIWLWRARPDFGILFTHVPIVRSSLFRNNRFLLNVHGHVHRFSLSHPGYFNASVEENDYTPISIDTILWYIRQNDDLIQRGE